MERIDDFVSGLSSWCDELGLRDAPDGDVVRQLLEIRRSYFDAPADLLSWPEGLLNAIVLDVASYVLDLRGELRGKIVLAASAIVAYVLAVGSPEDPDFFRDEPGILERTIGDGGTLTDKPLVEWSIRRKLIALKKRDMMAVPADQQREVLTDWNQRFLAQPWEERDARLAPSRSPVLRMPEDWLAGATKYSRTRLPSVLADAARSAPLMRDVAELADWLAGRTGVWQEGGMSAEVVERAVAEIGLDSADAVREAWRLAVLGELVLVTPLAAFGSEALADWHREAEPDKVVDSWLGVAAAAVEDLGPHPEQIASVVRTEVARRIAEGYFGRTVGTAAPNEFDAAVEVVLDRLVRLGAVTFDDPGLVELTPLGVRLMVRLAGWNPSRWSLQAGPWRPDLTPADLEAWYRAAMYGDLTGDAAEWAWPDYVDPERFGRQLVQVLPRVDPIQQIGIVSILVASGAPALKVLEDTRYHAVSWFFRLIESESVRVPTDEELTTAAELVAPLVARMEPLAGSGWRNHPWPAQTGTALLTSPEAFVRSVATGGGELTDSDIARLDDLAQQMAAFVSADAATRRQWVEEFATD